MIFHDLAPAIHHVSQPSQQYHTGLIIPSSKYRYIQHFINLINNENNAFIFITITGHTTHTSGSHTYSDETGYHYKKPGHF